MTLKIRETGSEGNHYKTICRMDIINKCLDLCKILKGRTYLNYFLELLNGNLDFRDINHPSNATFRHSRLRGNDEKSMFSHTKQKAPIRINPIGAFIYKHGGDLLSHTVAHAVPSALKSLTSVFGMGTGGSSSL